MAQAAIISAGYNVRINVFNLSDKKTAEEIIEHLQLVEKKSDILDKEIQHTLRERGGIITG